MTQAFKLFALWLHGLGIGILAAFLSILLSSPPMPRLIGHDCQNSGGDLWAMEESDFPACRQIERNQ